MLDTVRVPKFAAVPGERRDFYEAETSIGKLVQRVLRETRRGYAAH